MSDHIDVIGSGAATSTPDVVVLDTRYSCDGRDVASALSACSDAVTRALAAATEHGLTEKDRQSTGIGVNQRWDNQGQKVVGYTAYHSLRLAVRDRESVGRLISALASATGNAFGLDSVTLRVSDTAPLQRQAREAAVEDARTKAQEYAAHAGRTLGVVTRITEVTDGGGGMPKVYAGRAAMETMAAPMPVEAGESTVTATVRVRFALDRP